MQRSVRHASNDRSQFRIGYMRNGNRRCVVAAVPLGMTKTANYFVPTRRPSRGVSSSPSRPVTTFQSSKKCEGDTRRGPKGTKKNKNKKEGPEWKRKEKGDRR